MLPLPLATEKHPRFKWEPPNASGGSSEDKRLGTAPDQRETMCDLALL